MVLAILLPVVLTAAIMLWGAVSALIHVARLLWRALAGPESLRESRQIGRDAFGDY